MTHKEIKKDIHHKLEASLVELKALIGEKKFNNRIKKAAKLLAEGLGKDAKTEAVKNTEITDNKMPVAPKPATTPVKKGTKTVVKKATAAVAKKAVKAPVAKKTIATKKK